MVNTRRAEKLPHWVPDAVHNYLAHTVSGQSIRALARQNDCHPSTILRQVRRFEARRDDPLVDGALKALATETPDVDPHKHKDAAQMQTQPDAAPTPQVEHLSQHRIEREALLILRRLCEPGALLAAARDMDTAVIVREDGQGSSLRTATVPRDIAQAIALKTWIHCPEPETRILRYFITNAGRAALRRLTAEEENRAGGFRETPRDKSKASHDWDSANEGGNTRYHAAESPLVGLSRRRDRDGKPFLAKELVTAGERLREDFELSQPGAQVAEDWREALSDSPRHPLAPATMQARARVVAAIDDLGPGLGDVALHCCCFLEGLEMTEKKMGWSARSGKIVLRIALQRLVQHYARTMGKYGPMIG